MRFSLVNCNEPAEGEKWKIGSKMEGIRGDFFFLFGAEWSLKRGAS